MYVGFCLFVSLDGEGKKITVLFWATVADDACRQKKETSGLTAALCRGLYFFAAGTASGLLELDVYNAFWLVCCVRNLG